MACWSYSRWSSRWRWGCNGTACRAVCLHPSMEAVAVMIRCKPTLWALSKYSYCLSLNISGGTLSKTVRHRLGEWQKLASLSTKKCTSAIHKMKSKDPFQYNLGLYNVHRVSWLYYIMFPIMFFVSYSLRHEEFTHLFLQRASRLLCVV